MSLSWYTTNKVPLSFSVGPPGNKVALSLSFDLTQDKQKNSAATRSFFLLKDETPAILTQFTRRFLYLYTIYFKITVALPNLLEFCCSHTQFTPRLLLPDPIYFKINECCQTQEIVVILGLKIL